MMNSTISDHQLNLENLDKAVAQYLQAPSDVPALLPRIIAFLKKYFRQAKRTLIKAKPEAVLHNLQRLLNTLCSHEPFLQSPSAL